MKRIQRFLPYITIFMFIFLSAIRSLVFWSPDVKYIFGDLGPYALNLGAVAHHIHTLFSYKDSLLIWNPYYYAVGLPTSSLVDSGILYPFNWPIIVITALTGKIMTSMTLYIISNYVHLFVGALFVYKLLRRFWKLDEFPSLVGALLWTFIGFNVEFRAASPVLFAGAYLPICLYYLYLWIEEKNLSTFILFFVGLALSFLVGYTMVSILIGVFCFFIHLYYAITNRIAWNTFIGFYLIGFFLITLPLIAPVYFPSAFYFAQTIRTALTSEGFVSNAAYPSDLIQSFLPSNVAATILGSTEVYMYFSLVGILILFQSKLGFIKQRRNIVLLIAGIIGLILAFGRLTALSYAVFFLLPIVNLFRRLSVFAVIPSLVFCLFVAAALPSIETRTLSKPSRYLLIVSSILVVVTEYLALLHIAKLDLTIAFESTVQTLLLVILACISLYIMSFSKKLGQVLIIICLLIEASNAINTKTSLNYPISPYLFHGPNQIVTKLHELTKPMQRVDLIDTQFNYKTDYLDIEQTTGYLALGTKYGDEMNKALYSSSYNGANLRKILGVAYIVKHALPEFKKSEYDIAITVPEMKSPSESHFYGLYDGKIQADKSGTQYIIRPNPGVFQRVYLAGQIDPSPQSEAILRLIENADPRTVFLDPTMVQKITPNGNVIINDYKKAYLKATVSSQGKTFLANSTAYYKGWQAYIDGKRTDLIRTNWFMFGIYVPPGTHMVEFLFVPYPFYFGIGYLILSGLLLSILYRMTLRKWLK